MSVWIQPYAAIGVTVLLVVLVAAGMLIAAHAIGPRHRHGAVKDSPYESGMPVIGGTQQRFNVRFYLVALLFLLFDVEVVLLWPWALAFYRASTSNVGIPLEGGGSAGKGFLLIAMSIFFVLLVFGLLYEWKKGAFQWD